MRLVKNIVNINGKLIGFLVEATKKDLGLEGVGITHEVLTLKEVEKMEDSRQIKITSNGNIEEQGNFKLNELPILVYFNSNIEEIENKIEIIEKIEHNQEVLGFTIRLGDSIEKKYEYNDVLRLTKWFKPYNFKVVGGRIILEDLGIKNVELSKEVNQDDKNSKANKNSKVSLSELIDLVRKHEGFIYLPEGRVYNKQGQSSIEVGEGFQDLQIGEIAYPFLMFPEKTMNISMNFRRIGAVDIDYMGKIQPIFTYIHKTKNVVRNGNINIEKLAVCVNTEGAEAIKNRMGTAVKGEIDNREILELLIKFHNEMDSGEYNKLEADHMKILDIDLTNIMVEEEYNKANNLEQYVEDLDKVQAMVESLYTLKTITKYLREAEKELIYELRESNDVDFLFKGGVHSQKDPQFVMAVIKANVDINNGSYKEISTYNKESKDKKEGKELPIEIELRIKGVNLSKLTYEEIKRGVAHKLINEQVRNIVERVENKENPKEKHTEIKQLQSDIKKETDRVLKWLWLYKQTNLIHNGKVRVILKYWESKQLKNGVNLEYLGNINNSLGKLQLVLKNIEVDEV